MCSCFYFLFLVLLVCYTIVFLLQVGISSITQHLCPQGAYCTNTLGNYTCAYLPGYYSEDPDVGRQTSHICQGRQARAQGQCRGQRRAKDSRLVDWLSYQSTNIQTSRLISTPSLLDWPSQRFDFVVPTDQSTGTIISRPICSCFNSGRIQLRFGLEFLILLRLGFPD